MSYAILFGADLVALPSARIARDDVRALRDAGALLAEAKAIRDAAEAASNAARDEGYAAGKAAGFAEFSAALAPVLAECTAGFASENARREREIGVAAMVVIEQLIGAYPAEELVAGLAAQALHRAGAGADECLIEVAPALAEALQEHFAATPCQARVIANPELAPLACRVLTGEGRIIADLDNQLASLRKRWGITADERAPA